MVNDNGNTYLEQLGFADIAPMPLSPFVPATPAWWLLFAAIFLILSVFAFLQFRRWQKNQYRRNATAIINAIALGQCSATELPAVLKTTAMISFGRETIAALNTQQWQTLLQTSSQKPCFKEPAITQLLQAISYQPEGQWQSNPQLAALFQQAKLWVKTHKATT